MSIRFLRTLLAIERHGSFHDAAAAVGLTPSAVSMQMRALEAQLQTRIFERDGRSPRLNARGRTLIGEAARIVAAYEALPLALSDEGDLAGRLAIGTIPSIVTGALPEALAALKAAQPRIQLRLVSGLSAELVAMVQRGELDLALVTQPIGIRTEGLRIRSFAEEPFVVAAPKAARQRGDAALLAAWPFIRFNRRAWAGRLIDEALRRRGIAVEDAMEIDSLEGIAVMVSRGLGVAIVPERIARIPLAKGLRTTPFGKPPLTRRLTLVERTDNPRSRLVEALRPLLEDTFARPRR